MRIQPQEQAAVYFQKLAGCIFQFNFFELLKTNCFRSKVPEINIIKSKMKDIANWGSSASEALMSAILYNTSPNLVG